jgi:hypothetical protein
MWPFRKKVPKSLPIHGPWAVGVGETDGSVTIMRLNSGYAKFGNIHGYEHQVGIAIPLRAPEESGLPSPEEDAELAEIEGSLCLALEQDAESLLVAIITTGGMREFVFYTRAPQYVRQRFERFRDGIGSHEIQLMIQPDKDWDVYAQLRSKKTQ